MQQRAYKAVIFDLDGTLLDTIQDLGASGNRTLARFGFPARTGEEYRRFIGNGIPKLIARAAPAGTDEKTLQEMLAFFLEDYEAHCTERTVLFAGVLETVEALRRRGYQLAVLTNKTQEPAEKIIDFYFPDRPFEIVWGNNGVRPLKPAPDAGELLLKELGCKPGEVFYLGDGDTDMLFARRMGFFAAGASWGYRPCEVLRQCGAQALFSSMAEILPELA